MRELHLIAHNIRSRENVGSLFRTCDSLGVKKLWLTGYTPAPPDPKVSKVALGAERAVAFEHVVDVETVIERLKQDGIFVFALELTPDAQDLSLFAPPDRLALLLGTETTGVPPSLLTLCDGAIKISQKGVKESLNVSVAAGIASWAILNRQEPSTLAKKMKI
jgi:tRNA G18 (ribose-2'-O)-methylase SpoU